MGTLSSQRRAYAVVAVLTILIMIPLIINSVLTILLAHWGNTIQAATVDWLQDSGIDGEVRGVTWSGLAATVEVTTPDGDIPEAAPLRQSLSDLPDTVSIVLDVSVAHEHDVR